MHDHPHGLFWLVLAGLIGWSIAAAAAATGTTPAPPGDLAESTRIVGLGMAAALVTAISVVGAGYAVARIGSASIGAITEKPEMLPRSILFVALAEGLAVLGFAVAMMLLNKI